MARAMAICVAKILTMLDRQEEAAVYFQRAKDLGSNEARLIQWLSKHEGIPELRRGWESLEFIILFQSMFSCIYEYD